MDLETVQNNVVAKLPLLKQGDYEMWRLIIEQYFQIQDYALWDIIENGNSFNPVARTTTNADGTSTSTIPGHVTTEEKVQKKNDVKARSMLLMALPNEHQLTFNQYKDAKTLFEAIQTRFGGNDATKKSQKTLLKQMYENFNAPSIESLDSIFNRLQKIVSQLAILSENISQEDLNLKFLRILPSEWNTYVVVWRNKPDLDSMSFDDLYNNFKINVAFVSTPSSTNKVNTANAHVSTAISTVSTDNTLDSTANLSDATVYAFLANQSNRSQLVHEDLEQIHEDDFEEMDLKWQLALLSMRARKYYQGTGKKIAINGSPKNQESRARNQDNSRRTMNVEDISSKAMVAIDGVGFDWSYMADEEVPTNLALMAFSDSEIEKLKKEKESNQIKIDNFENASKSLDKLIGSQIYGNNRKGVGYNAIPPSPTCLFAPPTIDLSNSGLKEFQQPEFKGYVLKENKGICENSSNEIKKTTDAPIIEDWVSDCDEDESEVRILKSDNVQQKPKQANQPRKVSENPRELVKGKSNHFGIMLWGLIIKIPSNFSNSRRNFVPTAVLTKSGIVPVSAARPINTTAPKSFVNAAKTRSNAFQKSHSPSRRPFYQQTALKNKILNDKVNTAKINSVNTTKGNRVTSVVGEQGINDVKSSAC
ncbi:hypothetical protein Tco_0245885 [Tanacetum coccineum]